MGGSLFDYLLHRGAGQDLPEFGTVEATAMFSAWKSATDAMTVAGVLIDCAPLGSDSATTTVRVRDGETDEAIRWAASLQAAASASVEIRPVISTGARA